ncbi:unnamed protein product [Rotaria socialis]|uniref:Uncharacterized protein n=1 Tax=Rotaria socialis TaxID=392032 RepID=A0A820HI41_9BILA|nr:unnamed protein product [Rotaria socialis]
MHAGSNQASKIRHSEDGEAPVHWHVAALPSSPSDSQISSTAVTHSSSFISLEPPKQGGRHCDFIWLHFNDIGPTKTLGHRKAQCK